MDREVGRRRAPRDGFPGFDVEQFTASMRGVEHAAVPVGFRSCREGAAALSAFDGPPHDPRTAGALATLAVLNTEHGDCLDRSPTCRSDWEGHGRKVRCWGHSVYLPGLTPWMSSASGAVCAGSNPAEGALNHIIETRGTGYGLATSYRPLGQPPPIIEPDVLATVAVRLSPSGSSRSADAERAGPEQARAMSEPLPVPATRARGTR